MVPPIAALGASLLSGECTNLSFCACTFLPPPLPHAQALNAASHYMRKPLIILYILWHRLCMRQQLSRRRRPVPEPSPRAAAQPAGRSLPGVSPTRSLSATITATITVTVTVTATASRPPIPSTGLAAVGFEASFVSATRSVTSSPSPTGSEANLGAGLPRQFNSSAPASASAALRPASGTDGQRPAFGPTATYVDLVNSTDSGLLDGQAQGNFGLSVGRVGVMVIVGVVVAVLVLVAGAMYARARCMQPVMPVYAGVIPAPAAGVAGARRQLVVGGATNAGACLQQRRHLSCDGCAAFADWCCCLYRSTIACISD